MSIRLGEYVIYGELRNTRNYSTFGFIVLRVPEDEEDTFIQFELTGNPGPDLLGKTIRFEPREDQEEGPFFKKDDYPTLQMRQVGPTGAMSAQGWVRTMPCGVEEFLRRSRLGEPPPTPWARHLYLEWYGQNGRVLIEMADPIVEECLREPENREDEGDWKSVPNLAPMPAQEDLDAPSGLDVTVLRSDGETAEVEHWTPVPREDEADEYGGDGHYESLQHQLDREAAAIDRAIGIENPHDDNEAIRDCELIDYCIDHEEEAKPVGWLIDDLDKLPRPDALNENQVEGQLKALLAELAMLGIAVDVCRHFTPRECYRLLLDEILPEMRIHESLIGSGWVQHHSTWDFCDKCQEEIENEALPDEFQEEEAD